MGLCLLLTFSRGSLLGTAVALMFIAFMWLTRRLTPIVAALVTVLAGRRLVRPILALTGAAQRMGTGDRSARVPVPPGGGGGDEVTRLAEAFNAMAERLEEARLREQARGREARLSELRTAFLAEASKRLDASLDYEATLRSLARLVVPVLADGCLIDLTETGRAVHPVALAHVDPGREPLLREIQGQPVDPDGSHPVAVALRTGESQLASEVDEAWLGSIASNTAHRDLLRRLAPRSFMAVPLVARGRTLGVVSLFSIDSERRYGPADVAFAEDLAQRAAFAVDNARLFREAQQAIRQAQAAIRSRDSFLARASHELRTPLTSALGTIRLLRRSLAGALRETPETLVAIASRNLESMLDLINDLLDASKLAAGRERLSLASVDLADIVGASAEILGAQARDKGVDLRVEVPAGLSLSADRLKLEQLFTNLLSNAVKFTPSGGQVAVEALADGGRVLVRVRDTGEGVATEHLERIFEPFFQGDETRGRRPRGTGLGLAICRQIVTLHRGTIWAESEGPGRGSTFVVSLPAAIPEGRAA
jgi:signal transduction histidine kinase